MLQGRAGVLLDTGARYATDFEYDAVDDRALLALAGRTRFLTHSDALVRAAARSIRGAQ